MNVKYLKRFFCVSLCFGLIAFTAIMVFSNFGGYVFNLDSKSSERLVYIKTLQEVQKKRLTHLKETCQRLTLKTLPDVWLSRLDHFIVDDDNKLIYCFVPKVACTNWRRVLLSLKTQSSDPLQIKGNESHNPNLFVTLNQVPRQEAYQKILTYTKFLFVRHPYERLVSAYRNKFQNPYSDYFRIRFGRKIIRNYRVNASKESLAKGHDVTFEEFLHYVVTLNRTADHSLLNEHWRPIENLCYPCAVQFDIIGKYETLLQDAEYTLFQSKLSDKVTFPTRDQTYNKASSTELTHQYFAGVRDVKVLKELTRLYYNDMQLFSYSESFLQWAKKKT